MGSCPSGAPMHSLALSVTDRISSGHKTETDRYSVGTSVNIIS